MAERPYTANEAHVLAELQSGPKQTLELARHMGGGFDKRRELREAIASLQARGHCIINLQDGNGYRLVPPTSDNMAMIERYVNQEGSRIKSRQKSVAHMRRLVSSWKRQQAAAK